MTEDVSPFSVSIRVSALNDSRSASPQVATSEGSQVLGRYLKQERNANLNRFIRRQMEQSIKDAEPMLFATLGSLLAKEFPDEYAILAVLLSASGPLIVLFLGCSEFTIEGRIRGEPWPSQSLLLQMPHSPVQVCVLP
jgi:hypothetical protein